jgi:hypothetical protein
MHFFHITVDSNPPLSSIIKCKIKGKNKANKNLAIGFIEGKIKMVNNNTFITSVVYKTDEIVPMYFQFIPIEQQNAET